MRHLLLAALLALPTLTSAQQYILPAAGNVPGANGTHFRSDVSIWNFREDNQKIVMRWLPQGSSGVGLAPVELTVGAFSGFQDADFVANVMKREGLGAIYFTAVRADGTPDPGARLTIQSRIWTPQPNTLGYTSQSFDAIRITQISGDRRAITNQRNDFRYRMNVGIVNLEQQATRSWQIIAASETTPMTLPPMSMHMISLPRPPNSNDPYLVRILGDGGSQTTWVAFGSSVDNVSGDAWSSLAYAALLP